MMTGGAVGTFLGGFIFAYVGPYGWRYVIFAGILPAFALLIVRLGMEEPEHFQAVRARRMALKAARAVTEEDRRFMSFVPLQLFSAGVRFNTLVGLLFCLGTLLSIWTSQIWLPTIQTQMLAKSGISGAAATPLVGYGMALWSIGGIVGYATFGFLADAFGRRPAILFYNVGAIASGLFLYQYLENWDWYPYALPVFGYFVYGVFSGHAVYLPELFPTHIRATAVSFCNGSGRVVTSFGPLVAGLMVGAFGGQFNRAAAVMTCMAVLSILAMAIGRETRDEQLPH
jgi:MFS family permease